MLEDSAFRDFVGTFCKLSLEMVSMQSGVDVGAGAGTGEVLWMWRRIIFQVRARVLRASLLPARNSSAGGLAGSIFRGRWCVVSTFICLPQLRERSEQRSGDFGIARLGGVAALTGNIQRLVYRPSNVPWDAITSHLFALRHLAALPPICP
jgi:hypothetical protein